MKTTHEGQAEFDQFEGLIQGLIHYQYGYCDDFMPKDIVLGLAQNVQKNYSSDEMQDAGLGNKVNYHKDTSIRGDKIKWIEENSEDSSEALFLQKIDNFSQHLNSTCYTSITKFESHYARYEQDSFYKRHLDQFKNDGGRKFSVILYLNDDWQQADGGTLSLYPKDTTQIDIAPLGGRMVFFRSNEMEHEVHPSFTKNRISIAGWLKDD